MVKKVIKFFLFFIFAIINANEIEYSINKIPLTNNNKYNYKFLVAGHTYGSPSNKRSLFPSPSLISNIDMIDSMDIDFMVLLGDSYWKSDSIYINNFKKSFLNKISCPVFNVVGNHELFGEIYYEEYFDKTFYSFVYSNDLFVFLNSEKYLNKQNRFLEKIITSVKKDHTINRIFLFSHKLLWVINEPKYKNVYKGLNSNIGYEDKLLYKQMIFDFIHKIDNPIVWFAGDIGLAHSLPILYDYNRENNIEYLATGLGNTEADNIILVEINKDQPRANFKEISLTGIKLNPIKSYNVEYWNSIYIKKITFFDFFKKIIRVLLNPYYLIGVVTGFGIFFIYHFKRFSR